MILFRRSFWLRGLIAGACALVLGACSRENRQARHLQRAATYVAANDRASAEIELLNALRIDPRHVPANLQLAQLYLDQGRLAQALPLLANARQLEPANPDVRLAYGNAWLSAGRLEDSRREALEVLARRPLDSAAWLLLAESSTTDEQLAEARERLQPAADGTALDCTQLAAQAVVAVRQRRLTEARELVGQALAADGKLSAPHTVAATIALAEGDTSAAAAAFARAAELAPPRAAPRVLAARFALSHGDRDGARRLLDATLAAAPDYLPVLVLRAELALSEQDLATCEEILGRARKVDATFSDLQVVGARLKLARGEYAAAETDLQKLVESFPQSAQLHYLLALARLGGPNPAGAPAALSRAIALAPQNTEAILLLANLDLRRDNAGAAVIALQNLTRREPGLEAAWALLADAYEKQGNFVAALETITAAEQHFADRPQPLVRKAAIQRRLNRLDDARATLHRALALSPGHAAAIEGLIDMDLAANDVDAAQARAEAFVRAAPEQPEAQMLAARVALVRGDSGRAETALRSVIKLRPDFGRAYVMLARLFIQGQRAPDALQELEQAARRDPSDPSVHMLIGMLRQQMDDIDRARAAYERVIALRPDFVQALNNLAYIYSEFDHQLDRAQAMAEKARKLAPSDPYVLDTLGWILFQKQQYTWARSLFVESASKLADNPEVQAHLGLAHYMLGETGRATTALRAYFATTPADTIAAEARECLNLLELDPATSDDSVRRQAEARLQQRADDPVAILRLAAWHEFNGRGSDARSAFDRGLKQQPRNVRLRIALAGLLLRQGAPAEAYALARAAYQDAPDDVLVAHQTGRLAFEQGEHETAANILRDSARRRPRDAGTQRDLAEALVSIGDLAGARAALQSALEIGLPEAEAASVQDALRLLTSILAPHPGSRPDAAAVDSPLAQLAAAVQLERTGDLPGSARHYEMVLTRYPSCHFAALRLASVYLDVPAQRARARALAQQERTAQPDNPETARVLGTLNFLEGDYERAVPLLTEAMHKQPENAHVCWLLGNALAQLQRLPEARSAWQRALDRGLAGPEAEKVRQQLATQLTHS